MFGILIWQGADKADQIDSPRIYAVITSIIILALVGLILVINIGVYPILTALIATAFGSAITYSRFVVQSETPKEVEQGGHGDAE
jgi:CHASE2 domain-containing sensor protein